ncbi:SH3 domain-containing kinase-binding protein 1-like isoform X1 [Podarcis raffonei]|uniref:SH3 domain-containing kinase-binding protein 1-like isoform X1 n=1 Tax=Podarcis raffonei TaxID=65483 RepID=UPI0023296369|nr:SH3 domain-containing kinase-binding protein 1-like isoform X1 [Podarcis raffonei]
MEVLVLVDFDGQLGDELKITAGDIIQKVQPGPEEGWLQGELEGRVGLFPRQFVQEIPVSLRADGTQRYPRSIRSVHAVNKLPAAKERWCRVTFSYTPAKDDELELCPGEVVQILEQIEDGWWLGKKNGKLGAFPSNFVQELNDLPSEMVFAEPKVGAGKQRPKMTNETFVLSEPEKVENTLEKPTPPRMQASPKVQALQTNDAPVYCRAMFDYEPEHEDELLLRKGDLVLLLSKETADMGWWEGECRGRKGLFPDNFVMPLAQVEPEIKAKVPERRKDSEKAPKPGKKVLQGGKVEMKHPGDHKDSKEQKKMESPRLTPLPVKKAAPPPPVPAKTKPAPNIPHKSLGIPVPSTATPVGKGKCKEKIAEINTFDAVLVPSAKLSHPTASRPKVPGKRPPSQLMTSSLDEIESTQPSSSTEKAKGPELLKEQSSYTREEPTALTCEASQTEEQPASLDDLKAELRSLKTMMDLMRAQHRKDMEDLKVEMGREQTKRAALQAEIEWLKQTVPVPGSLDSKRHAPGSGATELAGPAIPSSHTPNTPSAISTKD